MVVSCHGEERETTGAQVKMERVAEGDRVDGYLPTLGKKSSFCRWCKCPCLVFSFPDPFFFSVFIYKLKSYLSYDRFSPPSTCCVYLCSLLVCVYFCVPPTSYFILPPLCVCIISCLFFVIYFLLFYRLYVKVVGMRVVSKNGVVWW